MRIGIDIDGVITDIDKFRKEHGKVYFNREVVKTSGDIDELFGVSEEEKKRFWDDNFKDYIFGCPLKEGTKEVIDKLHKDGHKIYIITARKAKEKFDFYTGKKYKKTTREYLIRNNIYFDELSYYPMPKVRSVLDKKLDIFIEDSYFSACELAKLVDVFLFSNEQTNDSTEKIKKVQSWNEVYELINQMEKEER